MKGLTDPRSRRRARRLGPLTLGALTLLAACTAGGEAASDGPSPAPEPGNASGTVTFWHFFTGREEEAIEAVVRDFEAEFPDITVQIRGAQDDERMRQAIASGRGPDVGLSYSTDIVGNFCSTGAWRDLAPYIERDQVDLNSLLPIVRSYTEFEGTRCAMPVLADAYGLYYNKELLAAAGYTEPPKTLSDLEEMAKKLTQRAPDGTIEVAGFVPLLDYYENSPSHWAPHWGATWLKPDGTSAVAEDEAWQEMLRWQKGLVDWYGIENLTKFSAAKGQEFSADNDFHRGKVAMMMDGEYRNAFLKDQAPDLEYGTAPFPVPDDKQDLYGAGYVTGNIIGISKGAKNPEAGWELIKYLTTDTDAIVKLSNGIKNIPTTEGALDSPDLEVDPNFQTFLDIFQHPQSDTSPSTPNGGQYQVTFRTWTATWANGDVPDLAEGLREINEQINDQLALGQAP